jgi:nucleoid DNA-binding protein
MNATRWLLATGLLALIVLPVLAQNTNIPGQFIPGSVTVLPYSPPTLASVAPTIAKKTGLTEAQVNAVIAELGPSMSARLARGEGYEIPNCGTFRLIRIPAHRELQGNFAVFVPARNSVEFIPTGPVDAVLNMPGAVPGAPVAEPDFNPQIGGGIPTQRLPSSRIPGPRESFP